MCSLLHIFELELFKVRSKDTFADKAYTLLSLLVHICVLSNLDKIKLQKIISNVRIYAYLDMKLCLS
jgi:hypothetical protein